MGADRDLERLQTILPAVTIEDEPTYGCPPCQDLGVVPSRGQIEDWSDPTLVQGTRNLRGRPYTALYVKPCPRCERGGNVERRMRDEQAKRGRKTDGRPINKLRQT